MSKLREFIEKELMIDWESLPDELRDEYDAAVNDGSIDEYATVISADASAYWDVLYVAKAYFRKLDFLGLIDSRPDYGYFLKEEATRWGSPFQGHRARFKEPYVAFRAEVNSPDHAIGYLGHVKVRPTCPARRSVLPPEGIELTTIAPAVLIDGDEVLVEGNRVIGRLDIVASYA